MAQFHFVEDYERLIAHMIATHPIDEAMALAVGGGPYETFGQMEADILAAAGLVEGMRVIDLGCGSGRLAATLHGRGKYSYVGIDIIQSLLDYAKSKAPTYRFVLHRDLSIPEADASADFVSAFSLFTHLLPAETFIYMREAARVLRPGGKLVFSFLEYQDPVHWRIFEQSLVATRTGKRDHLDMFTERTTIETWAARLGLEVDRYFPGSATWSGHALGQSVAVLSRA